MAGTGAEEVQRLHHADPLSSETGAVGGLLERSKGIGPCSNRVPTDMEGRLKGAQGT